MKAMIYTIVCAVLCILICVCKVALAISFSDPTGDVSYRTAENYIGEVDNKPNIDITQLSFILNSNTVTLSLTVAGGIQISEDVGYLAYVNSTDTMYGMSLNNDQKIGWAMNRSSEISEYINRSVTVTGDTITAIFILNGNRSMETVYGLAEERTLTQSGQTNNLWIDYARYAYTPSSSDEDGNAIDNTEGNNSNENIETSSEEKTPGFELYLMIGAVTITIFLLKRRLNPL